MTNANYIVRTVNGTRYGFKATRVILADNDFTQKVYGFGTERFPSGSRIMVRVWDAKQNKLTNVKLARCTMVEAEITNLETNETFTWKGAEKNIG